MTSGHASPTVGIIGSGAAGSVAAYRLRQLLGPDARLVVFEKNERVGGRAWSVDFAGTGVEVGGTLIYSGNRRLTDLLAAAGLDRAAPDLEVDGRQETIAVWDGTSVIFRSKTTSAALGWKLVRHYGVRSLLRLRAQAVRTKDDIGKIYALQDSGRVFGTPRALLDAIDLGGLTDVSLQELLAGKGVQRKFVAGLVEGILRNMYNQNVDINALAGTVALVGGGFAGGRLFSVAGGNSRLFERALELASAELRLGCEITSVASTPRGEAGGYACADAAGRAERVDAVVIAAPLEGNPIDFPGVAIDKNAHGRRMFQTVHTTLVAGDLSASYFGMNPQTSPPSHVLTTASVSAFKSVGVTGRSPEHGGNIYKIFSAHSVSDDLLAEMFVTVREVRRLVWQAYPVLEPRPTMAPFEIADGCFYVNAFESAVSTLETEAVAAWNVAGLAAARLSQLPSANERSS